MNTVARLNRVQQNQIFSCFSRLCEALPVVVQIQTAYLCSMQDSQNRHTERQRGGFDTSRNKHVEDDGSRIW